MNQQATEFNIRPNASYPCPSWGLFLGLLVLVSMLIALRLAWLGFWLILPFTLLELGLLVWLVHIVRSRANYIEKIAIADDQVTVSHLQKNHNAEWSFPLHWSRVELRKPGHHWYPHRLLVGTSGKWVEVGSCLTDDERATLADAVRNEIIQQRNAARLTNA